jgi:tRNA(Ile)-lysidine synthase
VLPLLAERWPHAADSLARSAALCAEAANLLAADDGPVLQAATCDERTLAVDALLAFPRERRARVLRRWIDGLGLPPLPASGIATIESALFAAREDAEACFEWAGARVQRWRNLLHADAVRAPLPMAWSRWWDGTRPLDLPTGDTLELLAANGFDAPLRVHARRGGERILLPGRDHSHALKHVLQDAAMPPWLRSRLPLLSADGGALLAAGDAILSADMAAWLQARGARLRWTRVA